ncbi:MAG: WecB/TagA/CpsF family glycosyltransferase [Verrucomicrobiota bacterium]
MTVDRFNVLGVGISALSLERATDEVLRFLETGNQGYVCVTGVHGIIEAQDDPELRRIFNESFLTTPDGVPTVWIGKLIYGFSQMTRVYGPDLMLEIFRNTETRGTKHFLYGGTEGVAEDLRESLLKKFPNAEIVGTYCPPFRDLNEEEEEELFEKVRDSQADVMWVGISTPKQDRFMAKYVHKLPVKLMFGVGAAFDFHTGRVRQAPKWMQRNGLEWAFRLSQEPARLWKRYLTSNPRFVSLFALQFLGWRKFNCAKAESL